MAMNTAKRKQAIARAEKSAFGSEIVISQDKYMSDLIGALNYYNANHDDKDKKKWFISHMAKIDKKLAVSLLKVDENHFRHAGILARLMDGGSELQEKELKFFNDRVEFLKSQIDKRQKSEDKQAKKDAVTAALVAAQPSIQQRMEEKAHDIAGEIEGAIDDFILAGCKGEFSTKNYLMANQVAGPIAKRIGEFFVPLSKELNAVLEGDDEQLVEGYSNFNKREMKRYIEFVDTIIADCQQMVQTAKANRAPRKRKPVSPTKLVSRMKFLREFADLNLKSIKPDTIIGSSELWFYNTKYRRIGVYKAVGDTLSVKGTSIIGFDVKESKAFTLRKPEEFFKGLALGKRALNNAMKTLTTKPSAPNGRINEETILIGAF